LRILYFRSRRRWNIRPILFSGHTRRPICFSGDCLHIDCGGEGGEVASSPSCYPSASRPWPVRLLPRPSSTCCPWRCASSGAPAGSGPPRWPPPWSYEYLEAGVGPLKFERLKAFAEFTDADAYGLVVAALIRSPAFALRTSGNKLTTAFLIALQEFDQTVGDDMAQLDASSCVAAFNLAFEQLAAEARHRVALRDALSPERLDPRPEEPPTADD
jgi:hypothetical protein